MTVIVLMVFMILGSLYGHDSGYDYVSDDTVDDRSTSAQSPEVSNHLGRRRAISTQDAAGFIARALKRRVDENVWRGFKGRKPEGAPLPTTEDDSVWVDAPAKSESRDELFEQLSRVQQIRDAAQGKLSIRESERFERLLNLVEQEN